MIGVKGRGGIDWELDRRGSIGGMGRRMTAAWFVSTSGLEIWDFNGERSRINAEDTRHGRNRQRNSLIVDGYCGTKATPGLPKGEWI